MSVTTHHPQYEAHIDQWEMVEDCVLGEFAVKSRRGRYLPIPNRVDKSIENKERYNAYLHRAVFYNVTGRTLTGLTGQVFRKLQRRRFLLRLNLWMIMLMAQALV